MNLPSRSDTIVALATPAGSGAIAVIRLSGEGAIGIANRVFRKPDAREFSLAEVKGRTVHFGNLVDGPVTVDEVLLTVFRNPHSYTGEDTVEISCHGSVFIQQAVLQLLQKNGARPAEAGEFTLRAFLNGKLDLSQAEAVADLIAASSASTHRIALQQLRGGYSATISDLRAQLIHFASMLELELDFAEEDVEFANREQLANLSEYLLKELQRLRKSYEAGNVLKNGVPVVIAGRPNAGKSTLLNALLNEEKAIVSDIAGTTRDVIEDELVIRGVRFRFIDTAGIRHTEDTIERIGVERAYQQLDKASIVLFMIDPTQEDAASAKQALLDIQSRLNADNQHLVAVVNKSDTLTDAQQAIYAAALPRPVFISAKRKMNIDALLDTLFEQAGIAGWESEQMLVTNARHAAALEKAETAIQHVLGGMELLSTDLLALELKTAIHHIGEITGEIYTDDLLENIFSKFCIGK